MPPVHRQLATETNHVGKRVSCITQLIQGSDENGVRMQYRILCKQSKKSVAKTSQAFVATNLATRSLGNVQSLRSEMKESMSRLQMQVTELVNSTMAAMQAEAEGRVDVTLEKLVQLLNATPRQHKTELFPDSVLTRSQSVQRRVLDGKKNKSQYRRRGWTARQDCSNRRGERRDVFVVPAFSPQARDSEDFEIQSKGERTRSS